MSCMEGLEEVEESRQNGRMSKKFHGNLLVRPFGQFVLKLSHFSKLFLDFSMVYWFAIHEIARFPEKTTRDVLNF